MPNRAERHATMLATAKALLLAYEAGGKTHAELAAGRGVTRARVSQYIGIARLSRDLAKARTVTAPATLIPSVLDALRLPDEARASIALDGETQCYATPTPKEEA